MNEQRRGATISCFGCGRGQLGHASAKGVSYCHPDDSNELDCYHMATVYGWDLARFDQWLIDNGVDA